MASPKDVAVWMAEELGRVKYLYQEAVVYQIEERFGSDFVYVNDNGNLAIERRVLREFRTLTNEKVILGAWGAFVACERELRSSWTPGGLGSAAFIRLWGLWVGPSI